MSCSSINYVIGLLFVHMAWQVHGKEQYPQVSVIGVNPEGHMLSRFIPLILVLYVVCVLTPLLGCSTCSGVSDWMPCHVWKVCITYLLSIQNICYIYHGL